MATAPKPADTTIKKNPYVVKGADIWTSEGRKAVGATVELTPSEARHFVKSGHLAPYIPDEDISERVDD
jgi:hypothetical protein